MRMPALACAVTFLFSSPALADVYELYVAPRDSDAAKAAEALADDHHQWFPKLPRALTRAIELLNGTANEVRVNVAQGPAGGAVAFPNGLDASKAKLLLLGGWCADWKQRDPFGCATTFQTGQGRNTGFFSFGGNKTAFDTLVISGFVMDAADSNQYDAKTNSLLKGSSATTPLLQLSQVVVQHLVISDDVFVNGAQRAFEVFHSPASNDAEVEIANNFFLNTVIPLKFAPAGYKGFKTRRIHFVHNSVIANWPFNPDPTSSNVGALELYHRDCCGELVLEGNLFAFNVGGAMQHDWPTNRMGTLKLRDNLFFQNATLFSDARPEAGVFTGKFGSGGVHQVVALAAHMEDDFDYDFKDNVSFDPKLPVQLDPLLAANSGAVQAQKTTMNEVRQVLGKNQQGGTVAIKNYAPRMTVDAAKLPFPAEPKASRYGVQRAQRYTP